MQPDTRDAFRHNNFDLLRFLFASTVMAVHAYVLSGAPELAVVVEWLSSEVAVEAFFVVSGLLVFMSYERSRTLAEYAVKRARRIYPAYFVVVAGAGLLLFAASAASPSAYFLDGLPRYLAANLAFLNFLHPVLPGVFEANPRPEINGALWTLKIEVMFYLSVPVFVWLFRRVGRLRVLVATYLLSVLYAWAMGRLAQDTGSGLYAALARQLPGQLSFFMVGGFFYYYLDFFRRRLAWFVAGALALAALDRVLPLPALEPLWLGTLVAAAGFARPLGNFGRYGDFSYGIYILHFPVVQLLVHKGVFAWSPWGAFCLVCAIVVAAAALLWHLVERPALARGSHYVVAAAREGPPPAVSS